MANAPQRGCTIIPGSLEQEDTDLHGSDTDTEPHRPDKDKNSHRPEEDMEPHGSGKNGF